jgi:hypothetical protein
METMAALNCIPSFFNDNSNIIGEITVVNPDLSTGMSAPNKQLLWNWKKLCSLTKRANNFDYNETTR